MRRSRQVIRLLGLLKALQDGERLHVEQLAVRFHVRRETVDRDLRALEDLGFPVVGDIHGVKSRPPGDNVYDVTLMSGWLFLIGRMQVEKIVSYREAEKLLPYEADPAAEHLLARRRTGHTVALRFGDSAVAGPSPEIQDAGWWHPPHAVRREGATGPLDAPSRPRVDSGLSEAA